MNIKTFIKKNNEKKKIDLNSVIGQNKDIDVSDLNGEKVMMNLEIGKYFMLNSVGSTIWNSIEDEKTVRLIIDDVIKKYDVTRELCEKEIIEYVEKLNNYGLITIS